MNPSRTCSLARQASAAAVPSPRPCRRLPPAPTATSWATSGAGQATRGYATQHQKTASTSSSSTASPPRRAVTPFNDDGGVPWTQLSAGEKTARAAQQTFNLGMVVAGVVLTGGVGYVLYTDVFSPSSRVAAFNRAVDRIRADPRCEDLLGDRRQIAAYGEPSWNRWRRARPIRATERTDAQGAEHLVMEFHVQGPRAEGTACLHLVRRPGQDDFAYRYLFLDVPGHERVYLENAQAAAGSDADKKRTLFGIRWA